MRRVWAAVAAVWALIAIVGVLAWSNYQNGTPVSRGAVQTMVVKGKNGKPHLVVVQAHATTSSSGTPQAAPAGNVVAAGSAVPALAGKP